jgi:cobyrinic acid a,c-diamide synthase
LGKLPQHAAGLDGWLLSPDAVCAAFHSLSAGADISLIEGCLGMFDGPGADGSEQGSTAQVTQWLQAPVVLVVDAQAFKSARSIVALIKGYTAVVDGGLGVAGLGVAGLGVAGLGVAGFRRAGVAGVILNKVSNKALAAELADGLKAAALDVVVLGCVPKVGVGSYRHSSSNEAALMAMPQLSPTYYTSRKACPHA